MRAAHDAEALGDRMESKILGGQLEYSLPLMREIMIGRQAHVILANSKSMILLDDVRVGVGQELELICRPFLRSVTLHRAGFMNELK